MKKFKASFFSLVFLNLIIKRYFILFYWLFFEFTRLRTGCSMKRATDHENSPREILEKFLNVYFK